MLTGITDWKIPCVYIHVYQIIKNRGPGPYNSLRHADNKRYFSGRSLTQNWRGTHMIYMAREVGKIWRCSRWEKGNFIMINEFKYGQTWKIWPSPLSLSLYSTFKDLFSKCDQIQSSRKENFIFFMQCKVNNLFLLFFLFQSSKKIADLQS